MSRAYLQWAQTGAGISLNQVATHIRGISKLPQQLQSQEFSNYGTLRVQPKMSIQPTPSNNNNNINNINDDNDKDIQDNIFSKIMYQFYKRASAKVREVETEFKKNEQEAKQLAIYYGCDESKKWEEIFSIFNDFRDNFIKAQKEVEELEKKTT